ncbi:MAG: hypothetical protein KAT52_02560, partial [Desulfobacterales bacterium]|nr:hypothetical protein [Desulfobacterales bacterium]
AQKKDEHRTSNVQRRMKKRTPNSEHSTTPRRGFFFSFPCSSVGMHTIWVPTLEHGNQAYEGFTVYGCQFYSY